MEKKKVMITVSQIQVMTAQHVLKEAGIESWSLDQTDSAHVGLFGDIKLYVEEDQAEDARRILKEEEVI